MKELTSLQQTYCSLQSKIWQNDKYRFIVIH